MEWIVGPCGWESKENISEFGFELAELGIRNIRGGIWKYRSKKDTYQGDGDLLLTLIDHSMFNINYFVEVFDEEQLNSVAPHFCIQVGSRNMHNTNLLKKINELSKTHGKLTVMLKRNYMASLGEFVDHSKYLSDCNVIMCLRGIFGLFPYEQRFQPDVTDIQRLRELTDNKICYDVSHSGCEARFVPNLIKCAKVYNPEYIMVEVHPDPLNARSDAQQQLTIEEFKDILGKG